MGKYSISELEKLSGIKAHTIRIWEQRYNLLQPLRTDTNIRYYDDDQLRKLLNIAALLRHGMKISHISKLTEKEFYTKLEGLLTHSDSSKDTQIEMLINQLIVSGLNYNEYQFEKTFNTCMLRFGLVETYIKILYPFLEKLGLMWGKEEINPAQEHFLSNLMKQKLFTAIDSLPPAEEGTSTYLLFLPEDENHELGLLFANYMLRLHKKRVIYLGQDVPFENLKDTIDKCKPAFLFTFFIRHQPLEDIENTIKSINSNFSDLKLFISGNSFLLNQINLPENVRWIKSVEEFREQLIFRIN